MLLPRLLFRCDGSIDVDRGAFRHHMYNSVLSFGHRHPPPPPHRADPRCRFAFGYTIKPYRTTPGRRLDLLFFQRPTQPSLTETAAAAEVAAAGLVRQGAEAVLLREGARKTGRLGAERRRGGARRKNARGRSRHRRQRRSSPRRRGKEGAAR